MTMAELTASQQTAEYESILTQIFVEINLLNQQMQQDRAEIDRLKADSARLEAETQSILSRLKVLV
jgi:chromosome segregation ATPase